MRRFDRMGREYEKPDLTFAQRVLAGALIILIFGCGMILLTLTILRLWTGAPS